MRVLNMRYISVLLILLVIGEIGVNAQSDQKKKPVLNRYGQVLVKKGDSWQPRVANQLKVFGINLDTIKDFNVPYKYKPTKLKDEDFKNCTTEYHVYKKYADYELPLEVDLPKNQAKGPFPYMVLIHGGGFQGGSYRSMNRLGSFLASHGIVAVRIEYTLAKNGTRADARQDMLDAMEFIRKHAGEWNLSPDLFGFTGASAGGNLASYMGVTYPGAKVMVPICGPHDLKMHFFDNKVFYNPAKMNEKLGLMRKYFEFDDVTKEKLEKYSPIYLLSGTPPPALLIHGTFDTSVDFQQDLKFAKALEAKGGQVEIRPIMYGPHAAFGPHTATYEDDMLYMLSFLRKIFDGYKK